MNSLIKNLKGIWVGVYKFVWNTIYKLKEK